MKFFLETLKIKFPEIFTTSSVRELVKTFCRLWHEVCIGRFPFFRQKSLQKKPAVFSLPSIDPGTKIYSSSLPHNSSVCRPKVVKDFFFPSVFLVGLLAGTYV